eukprot:1117127-Amphidinium_carterae.1
MAQSTYSIPQRPRPGQRPQPSRHPTPAGQSPSPGAVPSRHPTPAGPSPSPGAVPQQLNLTADSTEQTESTSQPKKWR